MSKADYTIHPKTFFQATRAYPLSDQDRLCLTELYQPLIGLTGLGLYLTLNAEAEQVLFGHLEINEQMHAELVQQLDLSLEQILQARQKLEGIGLLETFVKNDRELGAKYLYCLKAPETIARFFQDDILTLLLKNRVGQRKFDQLLQRFAPVTVARAGYQAISATFKEAYTFDETQTLAAQPELAELKVRFPEPESATPDVSDARFDWAFFCNQLTRYNLLQPVEKEQFQKLVFTYHQMYHIDELAMAEFASKAFDYYTSQIDLKEFKRVVEAAFTKVKKQAVVPPTTATASLSPEDQQTYRFNSLKMAGFSQQDIQLILETEKMAPGNYLAALKQANNGYVTNLENYALNALIQRSGLPNSVINILIHYIYCVEQKPTIESSHLDRIANDWARHQIHSPEDAIRYVRELAEKRRQQKEKQSQKSYGKQQPIRQETLPDWLKNPKTAEQSLSPEAQAEMNQQIQDFLREGGEE